LQGCNTAVAFLTNKNIQKPTNKEAPGNPIPIFPAKSPGLWSNSYSWATRPAPSGKSWENAKTKEPPKMMERMVIEAQKMTGYHYE